MKGKWCRMVGRKHREKFIWMMIKKKGKKCCEPTSWGESARQQGGGFGGPSLACASLLRPAKKGEGSSSFWQGLGPKARRDDKRPQNNNQYYYYLHTFVAECMLYAIVLYVVIYLFFVIIILEAFHAIFRAAVLWSSRWRVQQKRLRPFFFSLSIFDICVHTRGRVRFAYYCL